MAKPRSNADAVTYWAESILEREARPDIDVNSIMVRTDVVYSFGRHYPMGVIERYPDGRVKRVVVNDDSYPSRGWARTPEDQGNVWRDALHYGTQARVPVVKVMLTGYRTGGQIQCRPKAHDPEPEAYPSTIVPPYFGAHHPGDEPVHDRKDCIAGRVEEYEYQEDHYVLSNLDLYADDQLYTLSGWGTPHVGDWFHRKYSSSGTGGSIYARRSHLGTIVWGEAPHEHLHFGHGVKKPQNVTYKQCPCCYAHMTAHRRWYVYMHGGYELGPGGWRKGWLKHDALMQEHGGEEGWRQARREDLRRVRRARKDRAEWVERNFMALDDVPRCTVPGSDNRVLRSIVPRVDADGYPLRKDSELYFKKQRDRQRAERRRLREMERFARERVQVEKFKERVERNRVRRRECSFEGTAQRVADTLARLRPITTELESGS